MTTITHTALDISRAVGAGHGPDGLEPSRNRSSVPASLDAEWTRLRRRPAARAALRRWARIGPDRPLADVAADAADLSDVLAATRPGTVDPDGVLGDLVALAPSDEVAGRVVLQRLLPLLLNGMRRYRTLDRDGDPVARVIAAAWIVMHRYDPARRPRHVATRLASDATWEAFRRDARRLRLPCTGPDALEAAAAPEATDPLVELVEVLGDARRGGLPDADLTTLRDLVRFGSPAAVAAREGVTARAIRYRRDRAVAGVRAALGVDPDRATHPDRAAALDRATDPDRAADLDVRAVA